MRRRSSCRRRTKSTVDLIWFDLIITTDWLALASCCNICVLQMVCHVLLVLTLKVIFHWRSLVVKQLTLCCRRRHQQTHRTTTVCHILILHNFVICLPRTQIYISVLQYCWVQNVHECIVWYHALVLQSMVYHATAILCTSVTLVYCVEMAEHVTKLSLSLSSHTSQAVAWKDSWKETTVITSWGDRLLENQIKEFFKLFFCILMSLY